MGIGASRYGSWLTVKEYDEAWDTVTAEVDKARGKVKSGTINDDHQ
jgi:hypothetical protein